MEFTQMWATIELTTAAAATVARNNNDESIE